MSKTSLNESQKNGSKKITYLSFDKYVLRTPYLTFNEVKDLDIVKVRDFCSLPSISEAIYLASPELHQEMLKYLNRDHEETDEKLVFALLKYLLRMGTRCTPFGLFSGCSVGQMGNETNITLKDSSDYKRVTRLDMNYLCSLSQKLESDKEIREELLYYPNTSLYQIGDELRYVEHKYINTERKHFLMSIDANEFINDVMKTSEAGITIRDLASFIVDPEVSLEDATDFVHELIDNQLLISSISPLVTGQDYLKVLSDSIKSEPIKNWFSEIKSKLSKLDNNNAKGNLLLYNEIADLANFFDVKVNKKYLFQTDLNVTYIKNELNSSILEDVNDALQVLNKLSSKKTNSKLEYFKKKFYERFEEEEVPLTLALDVETGIGFGEEYEDADSFSVSELIDDVSVARPMVIEDTTKVVQTKLDKLLLSKSLSNRNKGAIIEIEHDDLIDFKENWDDVPNTFSVVIRICEVRDSKPLIYLPGFGGSTATNLLNRFSHVDAEMYNYVEEILLKEKQENIIFAEIVHLPQARVGNVLSRANLRDYEIPYLAQSSLPIEKQILITDLLVSVRNGRVVLRSKANNKEVLPMLSNAHNFDADPLPIYSFLCEMQTQNTRSYFDFKWGDFLINESYLPRVVYKNIIFSLATWKFNRNELKKISNNQELEIWLKKNSIPNRVHISDMDNNLFIDFENELSSKMFLSIIKSRDYIILKEYLFNEDMPLIKKDNYGVENEIILSFYKEII
ncbi:lantibiotic dehydratase family protein [Flavobacterium pectinovorum]|uniref:Lantibiotic dehydratase N-terminal domain-containing protein n=1 Tax=Flavobacterium pectinovorum TaxID=29533 RepID=A0A502EW03_9FLAO|nr:lantibiotic dehydratase family protein [Flavobacterium pectinovorum]TPG40750.1 hypothetical protein EAH81_10410 [Flavobacterium pectinovorum]